MEKNSVKAMIKVLLIDIGGVLLTNGWPHESREVAAKKFGFDFGEMEHRHELAFDVYEEGGLTLDDYLDAILFYKDRSFSKQDFTEFMFRQTAPLTETLETLIAWKARHPELRFFSLNNEPKELHKYRVAQFGLHRLYDGFVASCDVGFRKPDPRIYKVATGIAGVSPEECLYIDDREILVAAGKKAGLQGWRHQNAKETIAFLDSLFAEF